MALQFLRDWQAKRQIKPMVQHPAAIAAALTLNETLSDKSKGLGRAWKDGDPQSRGKFSFDLLQSVNEALKSEDPIFFNRQLLVEQTLRNALYLVMVLPPIGDPEIDETGLRGSPGISGELRAHIIDTPTIEDEELRREFGGVAATQFISNYEALYSAYVSCYWITGLKLSVFNTVRVALNDTEAQDWFRPFFTAMCVVREDQIRRGLGLPLNTSEFEVQRQSSFVNYVLSSSKMPYFEWHASNLRAGA